MPSMRLRIFWLPLVLAVFCSAALLVLFLWRDAGIYELDGDEPHYLVMANGIVKYHTFEQTAAYQYESEARQLYPGALGPHVLRGSNGLYNVHNIGLPLLLAVPFALGGVIGAKLFMLLVAALAVVLLWRFLSGVCPDERQRFFVTLPIVVASPLIPAATQIYPEIPAGAISVVGMLWLLCPVGKRTRMGDFWLAGLVAVLPWLQIKFSVASFVIITAAGVGTLIYSRSWLRLIPVFALPLLSCALLAIYNDYAFGKISGPYVNGAVEFSKTSLMVLVGLHLDQNQGFLILNPVFLAGLIGVGLFFRLNPYVAAVWVVVYISLIVPNSLHPNWYGGHSFSGRFGWAAALVFMLPVGLALSGLYEYSKRVFYSVVAVSCLLQSYFFKLYALDGVNLYNKGQVLWAGDYSVFYGWIFEWLPILSNSAWAYGFLPNYAWVGVALCLLVVGFSREGVRSKVVMAALGMGGAAVTVAGVISKPDIEGITVSAASLPSQIGVYDSGVRSAVAGRDMPGFLSYGPYFNLRSGSYKVLFFVKSSASEGHIVGEVDVNNSSLQRKVDALQLHGTSGGIVPIEIAFNVEPGVVQMYEFRSIWNGNEDLAIQGIRLERVN